MPRLFLLFSIFISTKSSANDVRFQSFGLGPAENVSIILDANPALPVGISGEKDSHNSLRGSYFTGDNEFADLNENQFDGFALTFNYSQALNEKWTWYAEGSWMRYTADHVVETAVSTTNLDNISVNYFTVSGGAGFLAFAQKSFWPKWNIIAGAYLKQIQFSQSFRQENGVLDNNTPFTGTLLDFDMESNPLLFGLSIGGSLGWVFYEDFGLTFFGFLRQPLNSECQSYEVSEVRTDVEGNKTGGGVCTNGELGVDFSGTRISGGFRFEYLPWQLSLNVSAPIIKALVDEFNDQNTTLISMSKSF